MDAPETGAADIRHVSSADGTQIGVVVTGSGPPVLVVHGTGADCSQWEGVLAPLSRRFTVYAMDRRGRGRSAEERGSYALEREAEDIAAIVEHIGEPPFGFAHGFGGLPVLKAVIAGVEFKRLLLDESPTGLPGGLMMPGEMADGLEAALEQGGNDAGLEYFLRNTVGLPDEAIAGARKTEIWELRKGTVPTVLREARTADSYERESEHLARVRVPIRFLVGTESTDQQRMASEAAHADMPDSELVIREGRLFTSMYADPEAVATEVGDFLMGSRQP